MNENNVDYSKRNFMKIMGGLAAAGAVTTWIPVTKVNASFWGNPALPNFPLGITVYRQQYKNWSGELKLENALTCSPRSQSDVIRVINWAHKAGYRIRAKGMSHNWSPIMLDDKDTMTKILLIDMASYINKVNVSTNGIVTAEAGVQMEYLLEAMESHGYGFVATPAPGDLTLGGVLAIDGHGTGIPAKNERRQVAETYGTISNLVTSLTAIVFDATTQSYIAKVFTRDQDDISALLVHLGRAFILSAQLQVSKNQYLRCQSIIDIHERELFASDARHGKTFSHFLDQAGRVEAIWFPFTDYPWLKVWSITPKKPISSKIVHSPFNYKFSDNVPPAITTLIHNIVVGAQGHLTPTFGQLQFTLSKLGLMGTPLSGFSTLFTAGLLSTQSHDLWGASKDLLLYVKPTTLRVTANGYAVITSRDNVQRVIHDFCQNYKQRVEQYRRLNRYPMNGPVEIRVTGLDHPSDSVVTNAKTPILSAVKPCPDHPEWDCAVWFDILTLPGTQFSGQFYRETEEWMVERYRGDSIMRPEWSKGWGYTDNAAWESQKYLYQDIPESHAEGQPQSLHISTAKEILDRLDPNRLFTSPLLDKLL